MVELNQLLQPLPVIGTDQDHCPMLLGAAASTLETMLSLSVNIDVDSAGASPIVFRAMVTAGGDRAVQQDDATTPATFQASVQPCWQARALEVHCLALSAAPHWWLRRIDREPYRARIEVSRKAAALTLIARTTYIISQ